MARPRRRSDAPTGPLAQLAVLAADRRRLLGLTQRDAAELAGVGISSIHALEAGSDRLTLAVVLRILEALGVQLWAGADDALRSAPHVVRVGSGAAS